MKITNIKQQVKRPDRYSIFIDSKYAFSLSEAGLLDMGLATGQEYTPKQLDDLQSSARFDKLYDRALNYISIRRRSEWEVEQYLKRKEATPSEIGEVAQKLSRNEWLNDELFAQAWVENRRLLKRTSKRRLSQELRAKRVSDEIIKKVLDNDEADEIMILRESIGRKRQQTRYKDDTKLIQYLVRQGFNYGDIKQAMSVERDD